MYETTLEMIDTNFIIEQSNRFSYTIKKHTVVVLDNAKVHQSKQLIKMMTVWTKRKLFIFYLPPYSPHLNIIERLWKEIKARWLNEKNYQNDEQLFYSTKLILSAIGKSLKLNYKFV